MFFGLSLSAQRMLPLPHESFSDSSIAQQDAKTILKLHGREDRPLGTSIDCFNEELDVERDALHEVDCSYSIGDGSGHPSLRPSTHFDPRNKMDKRLVDLQFEKCLSEEDQGYYKPYDTKRFVIHTLFIVFEKNGLTSVLKDFPGEKEGKPFSVSDILANYIPNGCPSSRVFAFDRETMQQEERSFMTSVNKKAEFESKWDRIVQHNILTRHAVWLLAVMLRKKNSVVWEYYSHPDLALNMGALCTTLELLIKKAVQDAEPEDRKEAHKFWMEDLSTWEKHRIEQDLPGHKLSTQTLDGTFMFRQETLSPPLSPKTIKKELSPDMSCSPITSRSDLSLQPKPPAGWKRGTSGPDFSFQWNPANRTVTTLGDPHNHKGAPNQESLLLPCPAISRCIQGRRTPVVLPPLSKIVSMLPNQRGKDDQSWEQSGSRGLQQRGQSLRRHHQQEQYIPPPHENTQQRTGPPGTFRAPPESPWVQGNPYSAPNPYTQAGHVPPNPLLRPRTDVGVGHSGYAPPTPSNRSPAELNSGPGRSAGTTHRQQAQQQQQQQQRQQAGPRGRGTPSGQYADMLGPGELRTDRRAVRPTPSLGGSSPSSTPSAAGRSPGQGPASGSQHTAPPFRVPSRSRLHRESTQPYHGRTKSNWPPKPVAPTAVMAPSSSNQPSGRPVSASAPPFPSSTTAAGSASASPRPPTSSTGYGMPYNHPPFDDPVLGPPEFNFDDWLQMPDPASDQQRDQPGCTK